MNVDIKGFYNTQNFLSREIAEHIYRIVVAKLPESVKIFTVPDDNKNNFRFYILWQRFYRFNGIFDAFPFVEPGNGADDDLVGKFLTKSLVWLDSVQLVEINTAIDNR